MLYNALQLQELLSDARYQDVGALPSQGHAGYGQETIYVRPFDIKDYRLISKSSTLNTMTHMLRAMDLTMTVDAGNLTIGDFYYLMMWQRIHSLPKAPLIVTWSCDRDVLQHKETMELVHNQEPYQQPENLWDYVAIPCDTHNSEPIHMTNVDILSLEDDTERGQQLAEGETLQPLLPEWADWPRARLLDDIGTSLKDPELAMLVPAAQWFKGDTLKDRFEAMFDNADGLAMERMAEAQAFNEVLNHGIRENTTLSCRTCRYKTPYEINITPHHFFP